MLIEEHPLGSWTFPAATHPPSPTLNGSRTTSSRVISNNVTMEARPLLLFTAPGLHVALYVDYRLNDSLTAELHSWKMLPVLPKPLDILKQDKDGSLCP